MYCCLLYEKQCHKRVSLSYNTFYLQRARKVIIMASKIAMILLHFHTISNVYWMISMPSFLYQVTRKIIHVACIARGIAVDFLAAAEEKEHEDAALNIIADIDASMRELHISYCLPPISFLGARSRRRLSYLLTLKWSTIPCRTRPEMTASA